MSAVIRRGLMSLVLLAALAAALPATAAEPVLVVHRTDGGPDAYPLIDLERIEFDADTLVIMTGTSTDRYAAATIERIVFPAITVGVGGPGAQEALPRILSLFPNQPNPFSPETRIAFRLAEPGRVELKVYSVNGRMVRSLVDGDEPAGLHHAVWDGRDDGGRKVSAGVYFYRLTAPGVRESRRMIYLP